MVCIIIIIIIYTKIYNVFHNFCGLSSTWKVFIFSNNLERRFSKMPTRAETMYTPLFMETFSNYEIIWLFSLSRTYPSIVHLKMCTSMSEHHYFLIYLMLTTSNAKNIIIILNIIFYGYMTC